MRTPLLRNTTQVIDFELDFLGRLQLLRCDELHAQFLGALRQLPQNTLAVALFVVVLTLVGVLLALREHRVDESGELVGRGSDGLGFVHA